MAGYGIEGNQPFDHAVDACLQHGHLNAQLVAAEQMNTRISQLLFGLSE